MKFDRISKKLDNINNNTVAAGATLQVRLSGGDHIFLSGGVYPRFNKVRFEITFNLATTPSSGLAVSLFPLTDVSGTLQLPTVSTLTATYQPIRVLSGSNSVPLQENISLTTSGNTYTQIDFLDVNNIPALDISNTSVSPITVASVTVTYYVEPAS